MTARVPDPYVMLRTDGPVATVELAAGFVAGSDDLAEGVAAFRDKRPPRFRRD